MLGTFIFGILLNHHERPHRHARFIYEATEVQED
jgi:hypothetical protein